MDVVTPECVERLLETDEVLGEIGLGDGGRLDCIDLRVGRVVAGQPETVLDLGGDV